MFISLSPSPRVQLKVSSPRWIMEFHGHWDLLNLRFDC